MSSSFAGPTGLQRWLDDVEMRHLRDMTPTEVARALRALSSTYVERRARLSGRGAFDSAGKRAAYALYYAPRRFLAVTRVLAELEPGRAPRHIVDLGCGTGAAGVAWAAHLDAGSPLLGIDTHPWALEETRATGRAFGVSVSVRRASVSAALVSTALREIARGSGAAPGGIVLSYVINELTDAARADLLPSLLAAGAAGARVLVMEPLSRRTSPWWNVWADAFGTAGGRAEEWRLRLEPPPITLALGRAAGLDPVESTGRTLWL